MDAADDMTTSLLRERVGDRLLDDQEIVSILRNWTVGELGTISACVGILAHYLAAHPELQQQLREQTALLPAAIDEFRLDRDPTKNLLYGAGIHVCPGAPLARLELHVIMEELLARTSQIALVPGEESVRAVYPASGFSSLPLWIERNEGPATR